MTQEEIFNTLKGMLKVDATFTDLDAFIYSELELAQNDLEHEDTLPCCLISEDSTTTTTVNEARVAVPTDFIREVEDSALWYVPDDGTAAIPLVRKPLDIARAHYGVATGEPEVYSLLGGYFYLSPIPDAVYTLRMIYYQKAPALTGATENAWSINYPDLLLGKVGQNMRLYWDIPPESYDRFVQLEARGKARLIAGTTAKASANYEANMGED